jgi:hypothetical protein
MTLLTGSPAVCRIIGAIIRHVKKMTAARTNLDQLYMESSIRINYWPSGESRHQRKYLADSGKASIPTQTFGFKYVLNWQRRGKG